MLVHLVDGENIWEMTTVRAARLVELGILRQEDADTYTILPGPQREIVLLILYMDSEDEL